MAASIIVRFAPSPTGTLHVGNMRGAVLNWLFARKMGGKVLLRIDDTDTERSKEEYAIAIRHDLAWLGLLPDLEARQSDRTAHYEAAAEKLRAAGRLYPCYETEDELERRRRQAQARHQPNVYNRAALDLTAEQRAALEAEGRKPHWRFKLNRKPVVWHDEVRGRVEIDTSSVSDPVLIREDGRFLYTLPSVVDDIAFHISHVIRGEDHVMNTASQIEIFEALGGPVPAFAHYPLVVAADGSGLSKRIGSLGVAKLRDDGLEPMSLISLLAHAGTSDAVGVHHTLAEAAESFAFTKISRSPIRFDEQELLTLNSRILHGLPYAAVAERLAALGVGGGEAFWLAVRGNLTVLPDARKWWHIVAEPIDPVMEDPELTRMAAEILPPELDGDAWPLWTKALAERSGRKGKALFHPLRLALTGQGDGPEMKRLLPLIGRARALARLAGERA
ncbi:MAG TPA: glutamate--tRNA ligase [Micropepsaceae bacterium]|nr:glutamate--tRNA ligase [Micropepsaceae bacterium]